MVFNNTYFTNNERILKTDCFKNKIVLTNTSQNINSHLNKIKYRYYGNYDKIPTYTIDRFGIFYIHANPNNITNYFNSSEIDSNSIIISLENVGWLSKQDDSYRTWDNQKYTNNIVDKMWRGKQYWADYSEEQYLALSQLLNYLFNEYAINKYIVDNNVFNNNSHKINGVINRSNFNKDYYDLTPAFNFNKLKELCNI